jgi:hypothetical protein
MASHVDVIHRSVFAEERDDGFGHVVIRCASLDGISPSSHVRRYIIAHVSSMVAESVRLSKKRGNTHSYVHVHMRGCELRNFPISFYCRLVKTLDGLYDDTLAKAFIYDAPPTARSIWRFLSTFVDPKTRDKITMVQTQQQSPQQAS